MSDIPVICRIFGHSYPSVFVQDFWGGLWVYRRACTRHGCVSVHRVGEVEFERKYAGR